MECNRIRLKDFRNVCEADIAFTSGVNILWGANAQGKTNLLEAISFAAIGKSFRTSHEEELIRFGSECAEISLDYTDSVRRQNITVRMMAGKRRRIEHNKNKVQKISDMVGSFRTVLFCPEHLSLVKSGPAERRSYMDIAISQLYPVYLKSLQRYNQILKQRNQLLKIAKDDYTAFIQTVEMWSRQLAEQAAVIAKYRYQYLLRASKHVESCFLEMTDGREIPRLVYEGSSKQSPEEYEDVKRTEEIYFQLLCAHHDREIAVGSTLYGIHKDDIGIYINDKNARSFASQGQQRSLVLAMKLAEGEVSAEICTEKPVFLFDDVFSELDAQRREYLCKKIEDRQVIITTCEPNLFPSANVVTVQNGEYRQER